MDRQRIQPHDPLMLVYVDNLRGTPFLNCFEELKKMRQPLSRKLNSHKTKPSLKM
jgi:hypothetical protein